ncbi:MAG: hypothetical protein AAGC65_05660 [Mucilaginibacter sp.]|uniref:hypothetical protein n=1 Tax=Mucilaginibacter sp. TaxID=1882438 RepID=UPI0031A79481
MAKFKAVLFKYLAAHPQLTPQENRNTDYNFFSFGGGIIYHGIGRGSMDMVTHSNWSETIQGSEK